MATKESCVSYVFPVKLDSLTGVFPRKTIKIRISIIVEECYTLNYKSLARGLNLIVILSKVKM